MHSSDMPREAGLICEAFTTFFIRAREGRQGSRVGSLYVSGQGNLQEEALVASHMRAGNKRGKDRVASPDVTGEAALLFIAFATACIWAEKIEGSGGDDD